MPRFLMSFFVVVAALAVAAPASAQQYGAIAISPSTGALGWSFDYPSRGQAENRALNGCYNHAGDCRVGTWFYDACGAIAVGRGNGWGASWGASRAIAERKAMSICSQHTSGCRVRRWVCSGT